MISEILKSKQTRLAFHFVVERDVKYKIAGHFVCDQLDHHSAFFFTENCVTLEFYG